jgi:hypothetical protein
MKRFFLIFVICISQINLYSQVPQTISWQGILQDGSGNNLNGQHNITLRLFDVESGGVNLWTETHPNLQITDGLANITLGSISTLNINFSKQYWLEIVVESGTPLTRIKLTSVPYSLNSKTVDNETDPTWNGANDTLGAIYRKGNVGIGTSTKTALLHTNGTGTGEGNILFSGAFKFENPGNPPDSGAGTRMMWYPDKGAFRVGRVEGEEWNKDSIGNYSFASGYGTKATGDRSIALGSHTTASGKISTAIGSDTRALASSSTAMGSITTASGISSTAMGYATFASGITSTAMGSVTTASGIVSTAMGSETLASADASTAMGVYTTASGDYSTAMGYSTFASGIISTAKGYETTASGEVSTSMGYQTVASGDYSTAMGGSTTASGSVSTALGYKTFANGEKSVAMGDSTVASGYASTSMGNRTVASGDNSVSIGKGSIASGEFSFASGFQTTASGIRATSFGDRSVASAENSMAMGRTTTASGEYAVSMGQSSVASGRRSFSFGFFTNAPSAGEFTLGRYNTNYTPGSTTQFISTDRLFVIGNGIDEDSRSNAMTVLKNGRVGLQTVTTPTFALELPNSTSDGIGKGRANAWTTYSDGRLKTNRTEISYGLNEIMKLEPLKYFHHNSVSENGKLIISDDGNFNIGFVAQDLFKIIPEIVTRPENENSDLWSVSYDKLTPVLVKAIQDQQKIIENQNKRIEELEKKIEILYQQSVNK